MKELIEPSSHFDSLPIWNQCRRRRRPFPILFIWYSFVKRITNKMTKKSICICVSHIFALHILRDVNLKRKKNIWHSIWATFKRCYSDSVENGKLITAWQWFKVAVISCTDNRWKLLWLIFNGTHDLAYAVQSDSNGKGSPFVKLPFLWYITHHIISYYIIAFIDILLLLLAKIDFVHINCCLSPARAHTYTNVINVKHWRTS